MGELHTKISRRDIKVTQKYQLSSKKVKKKKKYNFKNVTELLNMIFCPKNSIIDFRKTFITQEWLVVESCPTPLCVAFLMLYRLVQNTRSHFNKLILAWTAYFEEDKEEEEETEFNTNSY